ncbi:von Willebrand factor D and EGF domain-containing protein [Culex quinquefasciatus]|uniref:von Willebrand factor D and EGF domain-containing protein n=1 Tax=Culex quinquefasciatus TaxID=7176 RepID=UPI0018E32884|nr:von Willebrand factor D and EGF domain-containing protein [Culex quinquefasciatus]
MKYSAVSGVFLLALPLTLGSICWRNVSVPHVKWGKQYVSRTGICDAKCWGKWHELDINSDYYRDTCELEFKTELLPECCPGYEKDPRGECHPVCTGGCINGKCAGPNRCDCGEGFRLQVNRCLPVCESPCIRGVCTSPGKCSCLPGHVRRSDTECVPVCDPPCENGKCIAPNICGCNHGYEKSTKFTHVCNPRCDPEIAECGNGECGEPNLCICEEGYIFRGHRCVPTCDPACINGDCTKPNTCTCKEGFSRSLTKPNVCDPICESGCHNATCVAPNTCHCLHGYRPSRTAPNSCDPSCDPNYFNTNNGQCSAPNILRCNEGFLLKHSQESNLIYCKSRCSPECDNAHCLPDGTCRCWPEFIPAEESPHICEPLCDPPCENSTCVGPNQCKCWDGYQPTLENVCAPFCDPTVVDCSNGSCVDANTCICDAGLELISAEFNVSSCYPACVEQCTNGFCPTSAEVCECLPGYNRTTTDEGCRPVCEDLCLNGACTAPGVCSCDVGFILQNGTCERAWEESRSSLLQSSTIWLMVVILSFGCALYILRLLVFMKTKISCGGNEEKDRIIVRYFTEGITNPAEKEEML